MARFLAYTASPQVIVEVDSFYDVTDTGNLLRTLRPCMQVALSGAPNEYLIAPGLSPYVLGTFAGPNSGVFYVLDQTESYDRDQNPSSITTVTRLGALLLTERQDPLKVTADMQYQISRMQTYRGRARR